MSLKRKSEMAIYEYMRVVLTEQNDSSLTTLLTYDKISDTPESYLPVPGKIFDYFLNARECYVQWTTRDENLIALIFRNPFATRKGYYMITLGVKKGVGSPDARL